MSAFNSPFTLDPIKQQLRMMLPPKQRVEFDRLQAAATRGKKGLARLNPQPKVVGPLTIEEFAPVAEALVAQAIDAMPAEQLESLHVEQGSADAVIDSLLIEQAENEGMIHKQEAA